MRREENWWTWKRSGTTTVRSTKSSSDMVLTRCHWGTAAAEKKKRKKKCCIRLFRPSAERCETEGREAHIEPSGPQHPATTNTTWLFHGTCSWCPRVLGWNHWEWFQEHDRTQCTQTQTGGKWRKKTHACVTVTAHRKIHVLRLVNVVQISF